MSFNCLCAFYVTLQTDPFQTMNVSTPPTPSLGFCSANTLLKALLLMKLSNAQRSTDGRLLNKTFKAEGRVPFTDAAPEDIIAAVFALACDSVAIWGLFYHQINHGRTVKETSDICLRVVCCSAWMRLINRNLNMKAGDKVRHPV